MEKVAKKGDLPPVILNKDLGHVKDLGHTLFCLNALPVTNVSMNQLFQYGCV